MTKQLKTQWLLLALTGLLIIILKKLHFGVIHYNIFLSILLVWVTLLTGLFIFVLRES